MTFLARSSTGLAAIGLATLVCVTTAYAQTAPSGWRPGRTADGQPDIQGTWLNFDSTPFEAPSGRRPS